VATADPPQDSASIAVERAKPSALRRESENFFEELGEDLRELFTYLGGLSRMLREVGKNIIRPPLGWDDILEQCEVIGLKSMPIALLILMFVGLVFAVEFGATLQTMGAVPFVGKVTSFSIVRELGPVFTSLVVGGRVGAGMAAEIGSMVVTEQVDAIRALGANPVKKLIVPRIVAATLMLPLVALFADIVGIMAGMVISYLQFDLSMVHFYKSVVTTVRMTDFATGFFKPFFFGFGIAAIGCYEGMTCGHGTVGVGRATTRAVVNIAIMTVVVDFILGQIVSLLPRV
jgi:phospholipid/cholesterol/gamma-HCH transport system permease protein